MLPTVRPALAWLGFAAAVAAGAASLAAQATRLGVLQAEDRRAISLQDLTTIRVAARSADPEVARVAVRALGRLERPALVADIAPALRHALPEIRAEAANALAQAAQGVRRGTPAGTAVTSAQTQLAARLEIEADASVRAAICEALGRLPYASDVDAARAEAALVAFAAHATGSTDRLGIAKALEAFTRLARNVRQPGTDTLALLASLARAQAGRTEQELLRDARVRRLALSALAHLNAVDGDTRLAAATDPDPQVRRLALADAPAAGTDAARIVARAAADPVPMVRLEALRHARLLGDRWCDTVLAATTDDDPAVALTAVDTLAGCGDDGRSLAYLTGALADRSDAEVTRNWHRAAHALVALAAASPTAAHAAVVEFATSTTWQLRVYAARAAARLGDAALLEQLAHDRDRLVSDTAISAVRASETPRDAAASTVHVPAAAMPAPLAAADLRRLAAPRARFTIRDVGEFDVALFTSEAPATVLRFAELAGAGAYNGVMFSHVEPNALIRGAAPRVDTPGALPTMRDEVGQWPHVRGAVGLFAPGRDQGDGEILIDLVDNPQFDHTYTVFAQVLNGIDIVDRILESDVIERIEILP